MAKETLGRNVTFPIYKENGTSFHDLVLRKAVVDSVVMSLGDKITGEVYYKDNTLDVTMREYILYKKNPNDENEDAVKYVLVSPPTIVREGMVADNSELKGMTKYSFVFYHPMYVLNNIPFSDIAVSNDQENYLSQNKEFSWIGYPDDFIAKLNKNLQQTEWIVEKSTRFPHEKDNVLSEVLSFDNNTIAEVLKTCYETWDVPYVIDVVKGEEQSYSEGKRFKVVFGLPSTEIYPLNESEPFVFRMGKGVGLKNNSRTPRNNKIITRISGYGSESNIPYGYPQIIWTGDQTWNYTINNASGMQTIIVGGRTIQAMSYPIYDGIVGGQKVRLIKHPFTRTHLMPTVYSETVDKKVNPLNPNYDPNGEIVDYYDAIATQEYPYVNEIDPSAPSYEIHQFDIKPEMNVGGQDVEIVNAIPLNNDLTPADAWDDTMNDDGNYAQSFFRLDLPILSFDIYACASITEEMYINMRSGACIGCTFSVQVDWEDYKRNFYKEDGTFDPIIHTTSGDGHVRNGEKYPDSSQTAISLIVRKDNETFGTLMPNVYQQPHSGDTFVVLGISLPVEYITTAEETLDNEMKSYMLENNVHYYDYPLKFDEYFQATHTYILTQLKPNAIVHFAFGDIGQPLELYVKQLTIKYGQGVLPQYDITLTDNIEVVLNQIGQVADDVEKLSSVISILRENYSRNVWSEIAKKLSKTANDTAQGIISFAKGILFGDGTHGIDEQGNATLNDATMNDVSMNSAQTPSYSGTDIVSDKGFKVWEDNEGKSHVITDYFTARVKAFFASLEIRKIEHSAGNRIESPAGNTLALVKKFDAKGNEIVDKWYARRYKFAGVNLALKLVHLTGQFFGVWKEDPDATVAYYRCYWTAEDKEEKKAVVNNWKVGDQAFCQTFNLRNLSGYVSNKRYWRLVENTGYETIEGTMYAYIDLSNKEILDVDVTNAGIQIDAQTYTSRGRTYVTCDGYDYGDDVQNPIPNDPPQVGDDIACLGSQVAWKTRGGALQYITYGEVDNTTGIPCVKMYSGINSFRALNDFVIQKQSPKGVYVRADRFLIESASGTGDPQPLYYQRGDYVSGATYYKGDIVQYHGSSWLCLEETTDTPSESSEAWKLFASRGASTPRLELDSANAVVSANYEGKISNISQVTGLPTTVEVYVEGNKIPTSDWDLANSYIKWMGRTHALNELPTFDEYGVVLSSITINTGNVATAWEYRPEIVFTPSGTETIHPVINPTDFIAHIEFTYNGEAQSADISIPMIVQKAAANVVAQYSADNSSWHTPLDPTDIYVRYSYDGGTTWTTGTRFVGKSIEFDRGIRHFASYDDLMNYLVSIESAMTDKDMGYYIADTDDGSTPEATLWYFYSQSSDPRDIVNVPITDEVNYLTSYDGHLWNADNTSTAWADMGKIQGADGVDGISVTLDPATVIFEQDENNTSTINGLPFVSTIRVWKGTTVLQPSDYSVGYDSSKQDGHCDFNVAGNIVTITALNTDSTTQAPYTSGKVVITVTYNGTQIDLSINWAANLLGTWKLSVREDTMRAVSEQECAIYDENGDIIHVPFSSVFGQSAQNIFASVQGLKGRTGIDIEDGTITLDAERTVVTNDFEVKKVKTIPTESGIQIQIAEGLFQVFGLAGVANWRFGVNAQGQAILSYYNDAGQELYNLGPDGLSTIDNMPERFTAVNNRYVPSSLIGKGGDTTHNIGSNAKILELLKSSVWEDMFKVRSRGNDIYLYGARKTVTSGGTVYYGRDTLPAEVTYSATAAIASIADGKYFTAREDLQNATTGAAVNSVRISSVVGLLVTSLQRIEFESMPDTAVENTLYGLKTQHYNPYKSAIYDQLAVTDPGWFCDTFPTLSDIRANTIQIYTAILQDMAGNMFTVLQRKVYT